MLMIKNRLSAILGEQRMRVSELSKLSGISQNALNKIYHNKTKGIDFQTLDKLCEVLKCSTQDLFQYIEGWIYKPLPYHCLDDIKTSSPLEGEEWGEGVKVFQVILFHTLRAEDYYVTTSKLLFQLQVKVSRNDMIYKN